MCTKADQLLFQILPLITRSSYKYVISQISDDNGFKGPEVYCNVGVRAFFRLWAFYFINCLSSESKTPNCSSKLLERRKRFLKAAPSGRSSNRYLDTLFRRLIREASARF